MSHHRFFFCIIFLRGWHHYIPFGPIQNLTVIIQSPSPLPSQPVSWFCHVYGFWVCSSSPDPPAWPSFRPHSFFIQAIATTSYFRTLCLWVHHQHQLNNFLKHISDHFLFKLKILWWKKPKLYDRLSVSRRWSVTHWNLFLLHIHRNDGRGFPWWRSG